VRSSRCPSNVFCTHEPSGKKRAKVRVSKARSCGSSGGLSAAAACERRSERSSSPFSLTHHAPSCATTTAARACVTFGTCLHAPALLRTTRLQLSGQHSRKHTRSSLCPQFFFIHCWLMLVLASLSRSLNPQFCRLSSPEISPSHSLLLGAHGAFFLHAPSSFPHVGGARPSSAHLGHSSAHPCHTHPGCPICHGHPQHGGEVRQTGATTATSRKSTCSRDEHLCGEDDSTNLC
jgi:hypothetical protein